MKAILADAGGIIFDDKILTKDTYAELMALTGKPKDLLRKEFKPYRIRSYSDPNYSNDQAWTDFLNEQKLTPEQAQRIKEISREKWKQAKLYPGIKETIDKIVGQGVAFIIVTDSPERAEAVESWLSRQDVKVTGVVSSKDLGITKPSKLFFDTVLKKYGLNQEETTFLGHSFDELKGAYDLGYRVLALNYKEEDASFLPEQNKLKGFDELLKSI